MARIRLNKELKDMINKPMEGITAYPYADDLFHWQALMTGPPGSLYEEGLFKLDITFPGDYPFKPPAVVFSTPIYHPNINANGRVACDLLRSRWSGSFTIAIVLQSLRYWLSDPDFDDPLLLDVAQLKKSDPIKYNELVREKTKNNKS